MQVWILMLQAHLYSSKMMIFFFLNTDIKESIIKEQDKTEYRSRKVNVNQNKVFRDIRSWFEVEFGNKAGN